MERETPFGPWLRQRRKALDLTQWDLAERIACSGSTIQKIEDGVRRPSRQVAELLAGVLDIAPEERDAFLHWARLGSASESDPWATSDDSTQTVVASADRPTTTIQCSAPGAHPPPVNLPAPLTPLIGRENEMEKLLDCLSHPEIRLVTLTGPPGIGKTRLGIRLAAESTHMFEGGVYFAGLATVTDPDLVVPAIAQTLGVQQTDAEGMLAIANRVRDKRTLLVLDNFEQVLDAAPGVFELLSACPLLKLIVTSREALRAPGEWRFPVPPLGLPHAREDAYLHPAALGRVASVALFVQRAKAVSPDFELTEENAEAVASICMQLDGLPLSIELAAARIGLLTPAEIDRRLDSRLMLLKGGSLHLPARQRTLRGAIDWSYGLLDPAERMLFRRLAVFSGGFSLQGVENVCVEADADADVLDGVASLVNKSLLTRAETEDQGVRLGMLETLREYAMEQLEQSGEVEDMRRRHVLFFRDLAIQADHGLLTAQQAVWMRRLGEEHDNLRTALEWCLEREDSELSIVALGIAGSLWRFWWMHGHLSEGRRWLKRALEAADKTRSDGTVERRVEALRAKALKGLGNMALSQTDYPVARSMYESALVINRELGDEKEVGALLNNLGNMNEEIGRSDEARRALEESLAIAQRTGYEILAAAVLSNLGGVAIDQGDYEHARAYAEGALARAREAGNKGGTANSLTKLGIASVELGEYDRAHVELEEARQLVTELGDDLNMGTVLETLGALACEEEDYEEARSLHLQALAIRLKLGHKSGVVECLRKLAEVAIETGEVERAAQLYGAAEALREELGTSFSHSSRERYQRFTAAGRAQLDEAAWEKAAGRGRRLTLEQAVDLAHGQQGCALHCSPEMFS